MAGARRLEMLENQRRIGDEATKLYRDAMGAEKVRARTCACSSGGAPLVLADCGDAVAGASACHDDVRPQVCASVRGAARRAWREQVRERRRAGNTAEVARITKLLTPDDPVVGRIW